MFYSPSSHVLPPRTGLKDKCIYLMTFQGERIVPLPFPQPLDLSCRVGPPSPEPSCGTRAKMRSCQGVGFELYSAAWMSSDYSWCIWLAHSANCYHKTHWSSKTIGNVDFSGSSKVWFLPDMTTTIDTVPEELAHFLVKELLESSQGTAIAGPQGKQQTICRMEKYILKSDTRPGLWFSKGLSHCFSCCFSFSLRRMLCSSRAAASLLAQTLDPGTDRNRGPTLTSLGIPSEEPCFKREVSLFRSFQKTVYCL